MLNALITCYISVKTTTIAAVIRINSRMTKLALVFAVCTIAFAVIHSSASEGEALDEQEQLDRPQEDELDDLSRAASAYANAAANAGAKGMGPRPGPGPGPSSQPPGPRAVECYACTGCKDARNSTTKLCPASFDPSKGRKCVVYAEKYYHMKTPWYIRGCASERGSCADIRASHEQHRDLVQLLSCNECEGDKCNKNGAPHSLPDLLMAFIAMVVTPMVAKYTLS